MRLEPRKVELGESLIDLSQVPMLVESLQLEVIAWGLYKLRKDGILNEGISVCEAAEILDRFLEARGLTELFSGRVLYAARPRKYEIVAAINRIRELKVVLSP